MILVLAVQLRARNLHTSRGVESRSPYSCRRPSQGVSPLWVTARFYSLYTTLE